jgi:hypothetical protein
MMSLLDWVTRSAPARTTRREDRAAGATRDFWVTRVPEMERTEDIVLL